jgi:adenylate cyclase class 2
MHFEVEQKFPVEDAAALQRRLREVGAIQRATAGQSSIEQVDRYFNHPARDFAQTDEALRLRRVGEANFVTYKGPKLDAATKTRREIELPLATGAAAAAVFAELLEALGFRSVAEVRKTRRLFDIPWQGCTIEAALDDVAGLGTFLELELSAEGEADGAEVKAAKMHIASLAAALKLERSERRSYLELLLEKSN